MENIDHEAGLLNEVWQPRAHCSVIGGDGYIEGKLSSTESTQYVYVREEEWAVVYRDVIDRKEIVLRAHPFEIEELSNLKTMSAKKLVVEQPATVGVRSLLSWCSRCPLRISLHCVGVERVETVVAGQACQRVRLH